LARPARGGQVSGDRERIMGRIREALAVPAPRHDASAGPHAIGGATLNFREWLPVVGDSFAAQLALFARQCDLLRTELCECADGRSDTKVSLCGTDPNGTSISINKTQSATRQPCILRTRRCRATRHPQNRLLNCSPVG
jgi:hypothetical protein